jgi:hypothetical protein
MKDNGERLITDIDQRITCSTRNLVPRHRDSDSRDVKGFAERVKNYKKAEKEKKKLKKVDDIEVIEKKDKE